MGTPRRLSDSSDDDYSKLRRGGLNGHTKWIVSTVGALIVAALLTLTARDRATLDRDLAQHDGRLTELERSMVALSNVMAANQEGGKQFREEVLRTLTEIKADVKEVKRQR